MLDSNTAPESNPLSQGVVFNFSYGPGASLGNFNGIKNGFSQAAATWSSYLKDNVALNIQVEYDALPDPVIGGVQPAMVKVNYKDVLNALFSDRSSELDWGVLNALQLDSKDRDMLTQYGAGKLDPSQIKFGSKDFALLMDGRFQQAAKSGNGESYLDENGSDNNKKIWMTRANAKALGLIKANDSKLDAVIRISNTVNWDFDRSDGIASDAFDFLTVAQHELGHALGFVSGLDAFELLTTSKGKISADKDLAYVTPMDLFRFSEASAPSGAIDMTIGGDTEKYFSLDGGKTATAFFSTGGLDVGGDGYQASHWKFANSALGIMNPDLQPGQSADIAGLDLQLLDAIGWDLSRSWKTSIGAESIGWRQLEQEVFQYRQQLIDALTEQWATQHSGYSIKPLLQETAAFLNVGFAASVEKEIDALTNKLQKESNPDRRANEIQKTTDKIWQLEQKSIGDQLIQFADQLTQEFDQLDTRIEEWLTLDPKKLAEKLVKASDLEILKLSETLNQATDAQRVVWEDKLLQALTIVTDKPQKELEELMKNSGPGGDPIGWSRNRRSWGGFWQTGSASTQ
jgi:hypothetical protein